MTPTSALELIREALNKANATLEDCNGHIYAKAAKALSVLEANVLPELPEGFVLKSLSNMASEGPAWEAIIYYPKSLMNYAGVGESPRAAVLAALGRINERPS